MSRGRFRIVRNSRSRCGCGGAQVFECREKQSLHDSAPRLARDREKARRNFWSPGLMGGLTRGRVRSRNSRGIPKKRSRSRHSVNSVLQYLLYVIQSQGRLAPKNVLQISSSQIDFSTSSLLVLSFPTNPHGCLTILKST